MSVVCAPSYHARVDLAPVSFGSTISSCVQLAREAVAVCEKLLAFDRQYDVFCARASLPEKQVWPQGENGREIRLASMTI